MARTIDQIQTDIINSLQADGIIVSASMTSRRRIWTWVVAFAIYTLEVLFDYLRTEIDDKIAQLKPNTTRWYAEKAKLFQYGYNLVPDTDYYDNTGLTDEQVLDSLIIKYAAVVEQDLPNNRFGIRIKLAGEADGDLTALTNDQLIAFGLYLKRYKAAGTNTLVTSGPADNLKLNLKVYYNPLVLNSNGQRNDGTSPTPLQDAIKAFLKALPFNGRLNLTELVDKMQAVDGVSDPRLISAQAKYGALPYSGINDEYIPDAGYLRLYDDADLTIQWIAKSDV